MHGNRQRGIEAQDRRARTEGHHRGRHARYHVRDTFPDGHRRVCHNRGRDHQERKAAPYL